MNTDIRLTGSMNGRLLNNVACSGASSKEVLAEQFRDEPTFDWQYGQRPVFGKPQMAVIHVGGDDIDFLGLVNNCIYEILPYKSCSKQLEFSWALLRTSPTDNTPNSALVKNIASVIQATVDKGRKGVGNDFRAFVPAYARFFNEKTELCNKRTWNLYLGGRYGATLLSNGLRKTFNDMSDVLNAAVKAAVSGFKDIGVSYVEWNDILDGHRYCEGVDEPAPDNEGTWFFNHPAILDTRNFPWLNTLATKIDGSSKDYADFRAKHDSNTEFKVNNNPMSSKDFRDALYDSVLGSKEGEVQAEAFGDSYKQTFVNLIKVFHPKPVLHAKIMDKIFEEFKKELPKEELKCRGISGTLAVNKDKALIAADEFCKRTDPPSSKPENSNQGTPDDMIISLRNYLDEGKTITNHDECVKGFSKILDSCDGNNPANVSSP